MSKNLITRIITAAIGAPVILWLCYQGGRWLFGLVIVLAILAIGEFLFHEGYKLNSFIFWLGELAIILLIISAKKRSDDILNSIFILILFFMVSGIYISLKRGLPMPELFKRYSRLLWGIVYIGLLYPFVYWLGISLNVSTFNISNGDILLWLFGLLWIGDTAAMGIGKWLGRHKLAPQASPNKTIEGFIGGLAGALFFGIIIFFWKLNDMPLYHILMISLLCSLFGQMGDLVKSIWKRSLEIKDSSGLIPGHGGVIDRFDSLLFAAPVMYFYLAFILR